jgi:hypothetical protein
LSGLTIKTFGDIFQSNDTNLGIPIDCPLGQSNFTGYVNHFRMPSDVANQATDNFGVGNMWYSYDNGMLHPKSSDSLLTFIIGMVHYIALDMETDYPDYADASSTQFNLDLIYFSKLISLLPI